MIGKQNEYSFPEMQKKLEKLKEYFRKHNSKINIDNNPVFKEYSESLAFFCQKELLDLGSEQSLKYINNIPAIVKLCSIIHVLDGDCKFNHHIKNHLKELIKREVNKKDEDQTYQNRLFEFSMASRFLENVNSYNVDLSTDCDIIIDKDIAIECKYVHGENKLEDNIKKARRQLYKRITDDKIAKRGIIAVDLSNLLSSEFNRIENINIGFSSKEEMLSTFKQCYSKILINEMVNRINKIARDKIFGDSNNTITVQAILLQSFNFIIIDFKDSYIPFISRILHPIYNPLLSEEDKLKLKPIIKSLEVGY